MQFRKDINGLRAIAVIAVVLFHFNPAWVPGGFAGVDVFFVISGFLMTGIIFKGIEQENFSILKFYVARANRIIPALAVLCLALLVFGWFYLTPLDYKTLGKHVASSMGFLSNVIYWRESGYFDAASHGKWLLHTWSLSAEWQFYIIYPLLLVAMRKFMSVNMMKATVLLGMVLGFIYCIIATYIWPNSSYYLLTTRAWEMMLGGVAYLYPFALQDKRKKLLEWFGLVLIIGSYFLISKDSPWPGYLALFPVLGSFLIIQAQRNDSFLTSNIVSQKIGAWSYSIYLWHWPLVVAIYYFSLNESFVYLGIGLSVLLGFISNKYIEKLKFRNDFGNLISYLKCKPVYMMLVVGIFGSGAFISNGYEEHYSDAIVAANNEATNKNAYKCMVGETEENELSPCYIGNKGNVKAIIVGDSHADALTTSLAATMDLSSEGIVALTRASCIFILDIKHKVNGDVCGNENIKRIEYLNKNYKNIPIFWVGRTSAYLYGQSNPERITSSRAGGPSIYFTTPYSEVNEHFFYELKDKLSNTIGKMVLNHPVYIVQPTPEMRRNIPKTLAKNLLFGNGNYDLSIDYDLYLQRNERVRNLINEVAVMNDIEVLDPIPYLCDNGRCMDQFEGRPIYYDGDHMSEFGNKLLTPMFQLVVDKY
ncbi:MAG: acyltransferase [Gammaproteobacteria bacterium]|nr:acyltransferase [Gammaproteobacteria bacterium]